MPDEIEIAISPSPRDGAAFYASNTIDFFNNSSWAEITPHYSKWRKEKGGVKMKHIKLFCIPS